MPDCFDDGTGMSSFSMMHECFENEFRCSNDLCLPTFLINNGEQDCLFGEDENIAKENVTCPGIKFFNFRKASKVILWEFYGQSGICLPLPITRQQYQGQHYAFSVFIVLNFVLFLLIGAGQFFIFHTVRSASSKFGTERRQQELTIARRLFLIVFTDFLCWFPIGLMGLLASQDTPLPGEVNVWSAIFVLPLNSTLNPFLYTLNGLLERWEKEREATRMKKMIRKLHSEIPKWTPAAVEELTRICLRSRLVKKERVFQLLGVGSSVAVSGNSQTDGPEYESATIANQSFGFMSDGDSTTCFTDVERQ
nr:hypothetical protein BaRGS_021325 [Batillaria attramentaria]